MDYRINNEAIVGCVIAQVVKRGPYEVPFVIGITNLLLQKKLRDIVRKTSADNVDELGLLYGQLDGDLLGVMMNSLTMLIEGGCIERKEGNLLIAESGLQLCDDMLEGKSKLLAAVLKDMDVVLFKYDGIDKRRLYDKMWIAV